MRPSNKSRSRNKSGNLGSNPNNNNQRRSLGNIINRVFESAGPDGKVRGTPQQIIDKYQALARDAQLAGDRVAAESFLQHSEHYSRLLGEAQAEQNEQRQRFEREDERRDEPRGEPYGDQQRAPRAEGQSGQGGPHGGEPQRDRDRDRDRPQPDRQNFDRPPQQERPQHAPQQPTSEDRPAAAQPERREPAPVASSFATFDPRDDDEAGVLIDTPESASFAPEPAPVAPPERPAPTNGARRAKAEQPAAAEAPAARPEEAAPEASAETAETPPPAPKRGRPRRKAPRPEGESAPAPTAD